MIDPLPDNLAAARHPRSIVKVTWWQSSDLQVTDEMKGWVEWEVNNNAFSQADTFHVTFAQSGLPDGYDIGWWASQQQMWIEILAGFPSDQDNVDESELTTWIYGMADEVSYDPVNRTIEVSGRDLTSLLIDSKATLKWQNHTASAIATEIAAKYGLTPMITDTTTLYGKSLNNDDAGMTDQQSDWDLLTMLAKQEGFVVYVRGQALYFQAPADAAGDPYVIEWQTNADGSPRANVESISFSRNLTLSRDVTVEVKSWTLASPTKPFVKTATAVHNAGSPGKPLKYSYTFPNLMPEQAAQKAQSLLQEVTAHEVKLSASMPADDLLDVTSVIQVTGTGSAFDQIYFPEEVVRRMSMDEGYTMHVSAKGSSPLFTENT